MPVQTQSRNPKVNTENISAPAKRKAGSTDVESVVNQLERKAIGSRFGKVKRDR